MIPASVTSSVSANTSSAGALFPLMDPTSAELAEFDQLLGDFNQGKSVTALSMPALTLSNNASLVTSHEAKTPVTPEGLLSTLEQGAQLALQAPQVDMVIPMNQSLSDAQTMLVLNQVSGNMTSQVQFEALSDPFTPSPIEKTFPTPSNGHNLDAKPWLETPSLEGSSSIADETQNHAMGLLVASNQVGDQTSTRLLNQKINPSNASLTQAMTSPVVVPQRQDTSSPVVVPQRQDMPLTQVSDNVYHTSYIPTLADVSAPNNLAVTTANTPNMMGMPNRHAVAPVVVTTPTSAVVTENSMVSRMTEGVNLPVSVPLLGDNKAVVFASVPSISVASSGVMQAVSSGVEMPSTSQVLNSLATAIVANSTAGSNSGSTQQDQRQESSQSDRWMQSSEEAQSISDVELGADEFSLVSTTQLNQIASSSILSAPLNLRQPQWAQDVAQRVQVMINQSMNELEVRLDPLGLGPMKIGLKLDEQQKAHVTLSAQHGVTREMLENALPRLKDLLAQEGIELASATVDSGEKQTGNGQNSAQSSHRSASDLPEDAANTTVSMAVMPSREHLVDQFV